MSWDCGPCGQMRGEMGEAISDAEPKKVVKVMRSAIRYNVIKLAQGEQEAQDDFYQRQSNE